VMPPSILQRRIYFFQKPSWPAAKIRGWFAGQIAIRQKLGLRCVFFFKSKNPVRDFCYGGPKKPVCVCRLVHTYNMQTRIIRQEQCALALL
jgi:hypothetical protein